MKNKNKWRSVVDSVRGRDSCRELARKTGLDHSTISRLRNGQWEPHTETLTKLGAIVGKTGWELWQMADEV